MKLEPFATRPQKARQQMAQWPFEKKIAALVQMQRMAKEITEAAGLSFNGCIWEPLPHPPVTTA